MSICLLSRQRNLTTELCKNWPSCILPCSFCRLKLFVLHTKYYVTCFPYLKYIKPFYSGCKAHPHLAVMTSVVSTVWFFTINLLSLLSSITYAVLNYFLMHPASKACWDPEQCLCWKTQLNGKRKFLIYLWRILQKSTFHLSMHSYWSMLSCAVFEFLVHKKQLFCWQTTLTSRALLDMVVGISFRKKQEIEKRKRFSMRRAAKNKAFCVSVMGHVTVFDATSSLTIKQPHFVKEWKGMFYDQVRPNSSQKISGDFILMHTKYLLLLFRMITSATWTWWPADFSMVPRRYQWIRHALHGLLDAVQHDLK